MHNGIKRRTHYSFVKQKGFWGAIFLFILLEQFQQAVPSFFLNIFNKQSYHPAEKDSTSIPFKYKSNRDIPPEIYG